MARWHDNPYWMQYKMLDPMTRNRIIASTFLNYKITDWLHFQGRIGTDFFTQTMETIRPVGSYNKYKDGTYELYNIMNQEVNADVLLSARKELESGISLSGSVGANLMNRRVTNQNTKVAKLVVPDVYSVSNAAETPTTNSYRSEKEIQSVYATLSMGYKNQIFLDITGRNDWSSTLPANGNSYFYPSATTSWIFSETFGLNKDLFSFGKLRFGWAQVGNDTNPYQLSQTYNSSQPFGTAPSFSLGNVLPPLDLKNELIESMEVGTDIRFFSNRLGIDVTLYKTKALNQILNATITNTSGFTSVKTNAGRIDNKGIEIMLNGSPVRTSKFSWDIVVNWSKNENTVVELNDELETLQLYKMSGGNQVHAPVGGKYGTITGKGFTYNENGEIVVRANAKPQLSEQRTLGYIMPDWLGGINNTFRYKGLSMSFLIDIRHGGNIYSPTNASGWVTGVLSSSVGLNDRGVDKRLPVEDGGGITWGGVYEDGTPNTTYLDYHTARWGNNARGERFLYDASFVKLREANITFELPGDFLSRIRIKSASVSVYGRNLALLHSNVPNLDPESSAKNSSQNQMGYEYGSIPPSRHIGAKLRFTF